MFEQLGLIGCGLMGGSFALALKRAGLVRRVVGYSKSPLTLARARALGVIDVEAPSALLAVSGADLVLVAVPVAACADTFKAIRHLLAPQALLLDVGSTKADVVAAARQHLGAHLPQFVPAHPIAGKESAGIEHADAELYRGCQVILTPLPETDPEQTVRAQRLWGALGAQVRQMEPQAHDAAYAAVSHLPHLLAFAALNALLAQPKGPQWLGLAGPGFRDFSRIAASDPTIWGDILLANRTEVLAQLQHFRDALAALEGAMQQRDTAALQALIGHASRGRSQHAQQWPAGGQGGAGAAANAHAAPAATAPALGGASNPAGTPEPRLCLE
ncbi:prephenate dehydrogenase [Serpentinimonas raichei]|uniref:Prephenate dehydrogenase n=1 Tax=Serpentinimonas raichei TaxID=1458425 RepID=A0A060NIR9_9BURK|nr:prephenate dehydrogenase/arogenate dehydrogenase family protein [Serpentinimonas raichei]BAO81282.1 prephenate dehydrogenase [Serpentinimonas raichei]